MTGSFSKTKKASRFSNVKNKNYTATKRKNQTAIATVANRVDKLDKMLAPVKPVNDYYKKEYSQTTTTNTASYLFFEELNSPEELIPMFDTSILTDREFLEPASCVYKHLSVQTRYRLKEATNNPITIRQFIVSGKPAFNQTVTAPIQKLNTPNNWIYNKHYWSQATDDNHLGDRLNMKLNPKLFTIHSQRDIKLSYADSSTDRNVIEKTINSSHKLDTKVKLLSKATATTHLNSWRDVQMQDLPWGVQYYAVAFIEGFTPADAGSTLNLDVRLNSQVIVSQQRRANITNT